MLAARVCCHLEDNKLAAQTFRRDLPKEMESTDYNKYNQENTQKYFKVPLRTVARGQCPMQVDHFYKYYIKTHRIKRD